MLLDGNVYFAYRHGMDAFAGYDAWLSAPYTEQIEPPECPDCGNYMDGEEDADEDGPYWSSWCPACEEDES